MGLREIEFSSAKLYDSMKSKHHLDSGDHPVSATCQYPVKTVHSLLEIFRHTDYVRCRWIMGQNGALALAQWAEDHGVMLEFIKPGKPTQNAYIERFNRT